MADGTVRTTKKRLRGTNVKELVRGLRQSISVTKLLSCDSAVREYMMYCAIQMQHLLGKTIVLPTGARAKQLTPDEWVKHGEKLASAKP